MNQKQNVNINPDDLETVVCECGCAEWIEMYVIKKVSALISPNGQEGVIPIPKLVCMECGNTLENTLQDQKQIIN